MKRIGLRLLLVFLTVSPVVVFAWGSEGHQVIAQLAESQLTPKTKAEVQRLLAFEPSSTLASISTWADETRNGRTAKWHYVNFSRGDCNYVKERDCPDGQCLVEAVNAQTKILSSASAPDQSKLIALKYVVHLVGDLHQPLHAGFADDRGGNQYQVQAFGRGTNLHALWDTGLVQASIAGDVQSFVRSLAASPVPDAAKETDPARIAEESCRIAQDPGFYPSRKVRQGYLQAAGATIETRLRLGGARLARVLSGVLDAKP
jgi:hypothetical protein